MIDEDFDDVFEKEDISFTEKDGNSLHSNGMKNSMTKTTSMQGCHINNWNWNDDLDYQYQIINACSKGQMDIVTEYIHSHNVNDFLCKGWTPLLYAAFSVQPEIIVYLLKIGANPNQHKDGYTPLMAVCTSTNACLEKSLKCLNLLIEANANVDAANKHRQTALMYACKSQEPVFVRELIKHVKNINAIDNEKRNAIFYAVTANRIDTTIVLLENNIDTTLVDNNQLTVKDIAIQKEYNEILRLLSPDEEDLGDECNKFTAPTWSDLFPTLSTGNSEIIDRDVSTMLCGMGLEKYKHLFLGISLKRFLQLTENDLVDLGIDISAHRVQFINCIHKFHKKKWHIRSIGVLDKASPYTIYDGVLSLGIVAKQIMVAGCSFKYIHTSLVKAIDENGPLTIAELSEYEQELKKARKHLHSLKAELLKAKTLAKKISKESCIGVPATYVGSKRNKTNWIVNLSIFAMIGMCLPKILYSSKLLRELLSS